MKDRENVQKLYDEDTCEVKSVVALVEENEKMLARSSPRACSRKREVITKIVCSSILPKEQVKTKA